jgi:hypothetical protein
VTEFEDGGEILTEKAAGKRTAVRRGTELANEIGGNEWYEL